jgi:hypothetical protein
VLQAQQSAALSGFTWAMTSVFLPLTVIALVIAMVQSSAANPPSSGLHGGVAQQAR